MRSSPPTGDEVGWVLVVDDDPDDRADARQMLRTSGRRYEVVEAETGAAGVRAVLEAAGGPPDCVLLDYFLPDMDAPEVLAALAGPDKLPVCPVVVLTGADGEDLGRAVLRAGAQDYIGKDWLTPAGLVRAIENAAERWRMARELRDREEQLSLAFEAADLACFAWDVAADRVERRLSRLSSLPSTDRLGDGPIRFATVVAVVHPDDRAAFESAVRAALAGDGRYANRYRVPGADGGSPVWVEEHGRVWFDGGRPIRLVGVARDVTARQREAERRALLVDVARVVLEAPAADAALSERVFGMIRGSLGVDVLFNYQLAGDGSLRLMAEVGIPAEQTAAAERLELGQAFCGAAAAARRQLVADHGCISTDPRGAFLRDMGVRAYACHPLLARNGGLLGTFSVGSTTRDAFDPAEVEFLQTVCHFLALAWDRQRAEDAARRAEAFTRHVTDVAPSVLYVYDLDEKRNVWSNRETFALLGYTRAQMDAMAGDLLGTLLHPDDLEPYRAHAGRLLALADGEAAEFEYRMRTLDGSWRWLISRDMVFARHADGRPRQIVGAALDVTARKEGEQAVRDREDRLRLALEASATGLWTWDMRTDAVVWSPECYPIHGVAPGAFAGTGVAFFTLVHPADRSRVEAAVRTAVAVGDLYECEFRVVRPDGAVRWVANRGRASYDAAGAPLQVLGTITDITRRKQVEEGLARSERFARSVVESSADCVTGLSPDGKVLWMNENGRRLMECEFGRLAGADWAALWEPGGVRPEAEAALEAARAGGVGRFRGFCPTFAGTPRWWDVAITPILGPDGAVEQLLGVSRDVTDTRAAEQRLAESESFYRQTLESIPGMVFTNTPDGACDYVSGPWVAFTGVPAAEQLGRGWKQVLHPDDQDRVSAAWRAAVEGSGLYDVEYRVRRHDGVYEWFKARGRAIRDGSGAVVRWLGTAVNIDDLKQAEAALKARERELQTLADNSPDILMRFDRELRHVFANAAVEKASGLRRTDFLGRTNRELGMPPDVCDRWEAALRRVFAAGQPQFVEFDFQGPAGLRHYASRLIPEFGPDGRVEQVLGVIHDVTERKRFEQTLADQDRRKDEFLATLAHELRNPLAPIRNGLEILRMAGEVSGTMAKARAMMERQVVHLVRLVDDLLDISRVSRGKIPLRMEAVTVREIVGAAIEACRPTVDAKRHALVVDLPDAPLVLDGDRTRLVQVLSNILTNAAKYSEDGGQIRVAARREGDDAVIQVTDTGVGIAPDMLPTLWDMFAQVRDTLDKAQGGLGIGLSLVKKLVEMHGGSVTAESPGVGHGSTFTVRLPLAVARATIPSVDPADRTPAGRPVGRRVLVVDDNVDGAESLAMMLDVFGHRAEVALTGPAALAAAGTFRPEVVLCDIGLPGMDGYEVARRLRADPSTADTVLVALTGWGSAEDKRRSKAAGFDFHLTKPVEAGAVQGLLARLR